MLLFRFYACVLFLYEVKSLVNEHTHLGVQVSQLFFLDVQIIQLASLFPEHLIALFHQIVLYYYRRVLLKYKVG